MMGKLVDGWTAVVVVVLQPIAFAPFAIEHELAIGLDFFLQLAQIAHMGIVLFPSHQITPLSVANCTPCCNPHT